MCRAAHVNFEIPPWAEIAGGTYWKNTVILDQAILRILQECSNTWSQQ